MVAMDFYPSLGVDAATIFTLACSIFYMVYRKSRVQLENKIIASPPSSSLSLSLLPPSPPRSWKHDVFPSFHGPDVRKRFLSHIKKEFERKAITPFIDNNIKRGESIGPELKRAIQESKIAIVLLSKNYASSSWCLDELVEITINKVEGQTVLSVFYEVDPTDVKKQTGDFGKVFKETCRNKTKEKIEKWKKALEAVATIAGYHSKNSDDEAAMIEEIADDISKLLNHLAPSPDLHHLIGMGAHMKMMQLLLRLDLEDEVRMIGIWGPPGIGKSTIARFLFNQFSTNFTLSAIMEIRENYPRPCLDPRRAQLQLQNQMLSLIINHKGPMITHLGVAQERLKDKKVLLILDDVDQLAQLDALAREIRWFGLGSRIIIATEDRGVLEAHGTINHIYQIPYPSYDSAFQIFCMNAFGQKHPYNGFNELAQQVTQLAGKLPLGLEVLGSALRGKSKQDWEMALPMLRTRLDGRIESIFKFSYDALCDEDKDIFLYIACFFNYRAPHKVEELLRKKFPYVRQRLRVLAEKSLIDITEDVIKMHTLLKQFGRETSRKQFLHGPAKRRVLVYTEDICEVLSDDTPDGSRVIGIELDLAQIDEDIDLNEKALERMSNLQLVRIYGNDQANPNCLESLHGLIDNYKEIKSLQWSHFQSTCLPTNFNPEFLVDLVMRDSKLQNLWIGAKSLRNLKWVDLSSSKDLNELPDFSTAINLEELILYNCSSLMELPTSIGNLTKLQKLDLKGCSSLLELPSFTENVTSLQILDLSGCSSLAELPSSIGNIINLQRLSLKGCSSLVGLPSSIKNFIDLDVLDLSYCSSLVKLPSLGNATKLRKLDLSNCSNLVDIPSLENATNLGVLELTNCSSLKELPPLIGTATSFCTFYLNGCSSLIKLPSFIENITCLREMNLNYCSNLVELPFSIGNITYLREMNLTYCSNLVELPSSIGRLQHLSTLSLMGCQKLQKLPVGINLESLIRLDLTNCSMLKTFPKISTNINSLSLVGTAIEELPPSFELWPHLSDLEMSYFENLKNFPHALDLITELHLTEDVQEFPSLVKELPRLSRLILCGCHKLESLPQLPDCLLYLDARGCKSPERLDCFFHNPKIRLIFANGCNLNQNASRDIIIHTSPSHRAILPGTEVPAYFNYLVRKEEPEKTKSNGNKVDSDKPPPYFICPISWEIMRDPHIAADGHTYEGKEIKTWFTEGNQTSPMGAKLKHHNLLPIYTLRLVITDWLLQHPNHNTD